MDGKSSVIEKNYGPSMIGDAGCFCLSYCSRQVSLDREYLKELLSVPKAIVRKAAGGRRQLLHKTKEK
jgi:hypothetical protein